jgi:tetratricopeptide (TPR) repeat protein
MKNIGMKIIAYKVTITRAKKEGEFHINWLDLETNEQDSFDQPVSDITSGEMEWLWKDRRNQPRIGNKLFQFLDGSNHLLQGALKKASNHGESLQIYLDTCSKTANWPFELLAENNSFLLPNRIHLIRGVPNPGTAAVIPPQNRSLNLLFMASSALDVQSELDFEKEEEAIFKITEPLAIDMEVEDSGSLRGLREKLKEQQFDIIHLSGHADIDKQGEPFFVMEDETGYRRDVTAGELWHRALIENPPRLLFISGCRTGEAPEGPEGSFARRLVGDFGVPTVLGWGRPVSDDQATEAETMIYRELSRGQSVIDAVQRARFHLTDRFPSAQYPAWPLLRLFSNSMSLNAIVEKEQQWQPKVRRLRHVNLKNSRVMVLAEGFVGRRRQIQQSLHTLKQDMEKVGLLMLGTGGLGKSCLAGKIAERFKQHTLVIVHGRLDAITVKEALMDTFIQAQDENGGNILEQEKDVKEILEDLCRSCFKKRRYLILLDDFEQNLEGSEKGEPDQLRPEAAVLLEVLLHYLPGKGKITRIIITCRYSFSLTVQDHDLVKERLESVWLTGFMKAEQCKKENQLTNILKYPDLSIREQLLAAGCGNPRLMEWLDVLVGEMKAAEVPELLKALCNKKEDFIREHVIRELLQRGGDELERFLRWFAIFRKPVLEEGAKEVGEKAELTGWNQLLHRGMDLSLIEHDRARQSYQGTPLLRDELLNGLDNLHACHEAAFAYYKYNCAGGPDDRFDPILVEEWVYHALGCGEEDIASRQGGKLVSHLKKGLAFLEARRVGLWVLEGKKQELSTEHDAFLLNAIANAIDDLGDHRKAIDYYQEGMTIWKDIYGEKHQDVATFLNNLGMVWKKLGDHRKAIDYYQEALTIWKDVHGEKHQGIVTYLNNLGSAWRELGEPRKAIDYYQEALTIWKDVHGEKHEDVATFLNNLGLAWRSLGEPRKAIDYYQEALTIWKDVHGEKHPLVASGLTNLGAVWSELGVHQKAIDYYREALTIDEAAFGREHPKVALDLNNLGAMWDDLGDHRKAIDHFQEALIIDEAVFGREHPDVARDLNNLGAAWDDLGDCRKAIDYYQEALAIDEAVFGRNHPKVSTRLNNLGSAWKKLGDCRKAIDYYQEALTIDETVFGRKHPTVATPLNNLGNAWKILGEPKRAIDYYQQALSILKDVYGEKHQKIAKTLSGLGSAWKALGDPRKAIDYFQEALDIGKDLYGEKHPQIATGLNNLGSAWDAAGDPHKAIDYYQEALTILKNLYGEMHPQIATGLNNLGTASRELGDYEKAIDYLQKALRIDETVFGREHPTVATPLNNLGVAYYHLGQRKIAKEHFEQAYSILYKSFGPDHPKTQVVRRWLDELAERNLGSLISDWFEKFIHFISPINKG